LPSISAGNRWRLLIDTESNDNIAGALHEDGGAYFVSPRSLIVFVRDQNTSGK
jgi:hypothetical protein